MELLLEDVRFAPEVVSTAGFKGRKLQRSKQDLSVDLPLDSQVRKRRNRATRRRKDDETKHSKQQRPYPYYNFQPSADKSVSLPSLPFLKKYSPVADDPSPQVYSNTRIGTEWKNSGKKKTRKRRRKVDDNGATPSTLIPDMFHLINKTPIAPISLNQTLAVLDKADGFEVNDWPGSRVASTRRDVVLLHRWLKFMLEKIRDDDKDTDIMVSDALRLYFVCFFELIRQVSVQCSERGELLRQIWLEHNTLIEQSMKRIMAENAGLKELVSHLKRQTERLFRTKSAFSDNLVDISIESSKLKKENARLRSMLAEQSSPVSVKGTNAEKQEMRNQLLREEQAISDQVDNEDKRNAPEAPSHQLITGQSGIFDKETVSSIDQAMTIDRGSDGASLTFSSVSRGICGAAHEIVLKVEKETIIPEYDTDLSLATVILTPAKELIGNTAESKEPSTVLEKLRRELDLALAEVCKLREKLVVEGQDEAL